MNPVSVADIGLFLQYLLNAFSPTMLFAFTLLATFTVLFGVRRLLVGGFN